MSKESLYILMLEDNELDAELNQAQLQLVEGYEYEIKIIQDREEYIKELINSSPPDLILCDFNMPRYNGMDALKELNALKLTIPFIFVTGAMQEEIAADAIKAGAWDYVVKDRLYRLPLAVRNVLKLKKEKDLAVEANKKTQRLIRGIDETSMQVVVIDENYNIDYVNHNFIRMSDFMAGELVGNPLSIVYSKENSTLWDYLHNILKKEELFKGDVKIKRTEGSESWEHLTITPIFNEKNELRSYTLISDTITEQKKLEEDLKKSLENLQTLNKELESSIKKAEESDRLKTAFLANLSHEVRTPMNGILGFAGLLKEENLDPEMIGFYINIIEKSGQRMLRLIEDLVDISKIEANQVEIDTQPTELNNLMDDVFSFFEPQVVRKGLHFSYNKGLENSESRILIDSLKLEQILTNLINNAIKFTKEGSIHFGYSVLNNQLVFSVKDTGLGVRPGTEKIIFERFRQAEDSYLKEVEGSGLGLSISKSFVEKMGGSIGLESEYGKGSEFFVRLPFNPCYKKENETSKMQGNSSDKETTVLIAEDDEVSFFYIKQMLKNGNFKILHAENGRQAVQFFIEHPELDIILMDLKMPLMNGIDATYEIRKKNGKIPIIVQSAYTAEKDRQNAFDAGCTDFISKPIKKGVLLAAMVRSLEKNLH